MENNRNLNKVADRRKLKLQADDSIFIVSFFKQMRNCKR